MTDFTTVRSTARSARRTALRGAAVAATTLVPLVAGIAGAQPAAAENGPTVVGVFPLAGGCGLGAIAGAHYDEVRMDLETAFHGTIPLGSSTTGEITAYYGQDYLHAFGDTGRVVVGGYIDGSLALEVDMEIPACTTGASLRLELGTYSDGPTGDEHTVALRGCAAGDPTLGHVVLSESSYAWSVEVPPGQELCPVVTSTHPGMRGAWVDAAPVAVPAGEQRVVDVWVDYLSRPVAFTNQFVLDGELVHVAESGLDPAAVGWEWTNLVMDNPLGAGSCEVDPTSAVLPCDGTPRIGPGGALEVTLTGADGWALEQTVFLEASDCRSAPVSSAVADPTCWIDLRTLGTTPAEVPTDPEVPEVPETPEAPEVPETPESPAPAAAEQPAAPAEVASAAAEAPRTALPRTGAGGALALVGAGLVAAGRGILRARRRLAGS